MQSFSEYFNIYNVLHQFTNLKEGKKLQKGRDAFAWKITVGAVFQREGS